MFVLKCKKAKWDMREADRLRRKSPLLGQLERKLLGDLEAELASLRRRAESGEIGRVAFKEESDAIEATTTESVNDLRNVFALWDPDNLSVRVSVDRCWVFGAD